jgi:capsular polysaccharide export protein
MHDIHYASNEGKLYFFNFSPWRMMQTEQFYYAPNNQKFICKTLDEALEKGLDKDSNIFIYGIIEFPEVERYAQENSMTIYRIEDAFIRSVALGSGFAKPYSLSIDSRGIYFDPRKPSDLEYLLENHHFNEALIERAKSVRNEVLTYKFSKYNHLAHKEIEIDRTKYDKVILVTGQVEDDMSMKFGAFGLTYSDLLKMVRENNPNAYIIYKPHPDVLSGNRKGHIEQETLDKYVDEVQTLVSIDSCIAVSDEVHTLTSGAGFDALIRGKEVYTYGMPFYAGWGLTKDFRKCERRTRIRTLDELVAATLILFPRYLSPKTGEFCEVEQTLSELKEEQERYFNDKLYQFQIKTKSYFFPKIRVFIRYILQPFKLTI